MEFGPRALGNRSLLADPRRPEMRNILNQMVKHREDFRPFAPSVMAERADEWFKGAAHSAVTNPRCLHAGSRPAGVTASLPSCTMTAAPGCNSCAANQIRIFTS